MLRALSIPSAMPNFPFFLSWSQLPVLIPVEGESVYFVFLSLDIRQLPHYLGAQALDSCLIIGSSLHRFLSFSYSFPFLISFFLTSERNSPAYLWGKRRPKERRSKGYDTPSIWGFMVLSFKASMLDFKGYHGILGGIGGSKLGQRVMSCFFGYAHVCFYRGVCLGPNLYPYIVATHVLLWIHRSNDVRSRAECYAQGGSLCAAPVKVMVDELDTR